MSGWMATPSPSRITRIASISIATLTVCGISSQWITPARIQELRIQQQSSAPVHHLVWQTVEDLPQPLAQFDTVFWEPRDTDSLRKQIHESELVRGKSVLEIGTGTGLIAICCLRAGAARVIATDVNAAAIVNARHNADRFGVVDRLEARLVPLTRTEAFSVIRPDEHFDLIVSNPPWENDRPGTIAERALYDPNFQLLHSLLAGARRYLNPGGRLWLAYGCTEAIQEIQSFAPRHGWQVNWLDDRQLAELPPVFLPGLLLELIPIEEAVRTQ